MEQAEEALERPICWEGDHSEFMEQCVAIVQEWRGRVPPGDPLSRYFRDFDENSPPR